MGPTGPRWAPCWPHEPCYLVKSIKVTITKLNCNGDPRPLIKADRMGTAKAWRMPVSERSYFSVGISKAINISFEAEWLQVDQLITTNCEILQLIIQTSPIKIIVIGQPFVWLVSNKKVHSQAINVSSSWWIFYFLDPWFLLTLRNNGWMDGWIFITFQWYGHKEQLARLFHAWIEYFTLLKLGVAEVCTLRVLLVIYGTHVWTANVQ